MKNKEIERRIGNNFALKRLNPSRGIEIIARNDYEFIS